MEINYQADLAKKFILYTDKNIFLTGKAGTGKTTFLQNLKKDCPKRLAVVAPTGVAAINAGGVTIHSFFQLPFGPYLAESVVPGNTHNPAKNRKFNKDKIKVIQSLDLLVIDEISMVRADLLDGIDEVLRRYKNRNKPFGGVQLLMIGDLHQLSPVVKDDDWKLLRDYYPSLYFFNSKALQQTHPLCIELKHIYRQSDKDFISILNSIRENQISQEVLLRLNERYIPHFKPAENEGYIILTTHNNNAQEINATKLKELKTRTHRFTASVSGEFPEFSYPTDAELELKIGAQVMFVKNDPSKEKLFYNGKIGKITKINDDCIFVKCPSDASEIEVYPSQWENLKYELSAETREVEEKIAGTFTQYPLRLAWAITIHKSQGLTFEKAIIDAGSSFAHGQVYVALSRCKSFEGLVLSSPISNNSVKTDRTISTYTRTAEENSPGEQHLEQAKAAFQQTILLELFDFTSIKTKLYYLGKLVQDNANILPQQTPNRLEEIKQQAEEEVYAVAERFCTSELLRLLSDQKAAEENDNLRERIKKACTYFYDKINLAVESKLKSISLETDNKSVNASLKEAAQNLKKEITVKQATLKTGLEGFSTLSYLKAKSNAEIEQTADEPEVKSAMATEGMAHPKLYYLLKNWRDELAKEQQVPVYIVLPSKTIAEVCASLPRTSEQLQRIKGLGKQKVKVYGKEILNIVHSYCGDNQIPQQEDEIIAAVEIPKIKKDTKRLSLEMFVQGLTIEEIAKQRSITTGTVEGHLTYFIGNGELDLYKWIDRSKAEVIINFVIENGQMPLTDIKTFAGGTYSFGELRAIVKFMQAGQSFEVL